MFGNILKGAITEGFFEEAPQSGIERLVTNITQRFLVDPNQEIVALGTANLAAGLFQGFPMSASSSRTTTTTTSAR